MKTTEPVDSQPPQIDWSSVYRWAAIENIATLICVLLGCWLVTGWFALLLLNLNYAKNPKTTV